jgi:hypothetical protein
MFADMFIDALFKPGVKINLEHKPKYIYIVSYASSVVETWKKVWKELAVECRSLLSEGLNA